MMARVLVVFVNVLFVVDIPLKSWSLAFSLLVLLNTKTSFNSVSCIQLLEMNVNSIWSVKALILNHKCVASPEVV